MNRLLNHFGVFLDVVAGGDDRADDHYVDHRGDKSSHSSALGLVFPRGLDEHVIKHRGPLDSFRLDANVNS